MNRKTSLLAGGTAAVAALALVVGGSILPALANTMPDDASTETAIPTPEIAPPAETPVPETADPTEVPVPDPDEEDADAADAEDVADTTPVVVPPVSEEDDDATDEDSDDVEDSDDAEDAGEGRQDNHGLETSEAAHARNAIRHDVRDAEKADRDAGKSSDSRSER